MLDRWEGGHTDAGAEISLTTPTRNKRPPIGAAAMRLLKGWLHGRVRGAEPRWCARDLRRQLPYSRPVCQIDRGLLSWTGDGGSNELRVRKGRSATRPQGSRGSKQVTSSFRALQFVPRWATLTLAGATCEAATQSAGRQTAFCAGTSLTGKRGRRAPSVQRWSLAAERSCPLPT